MRKIVIVEDEAVAAAHLQRLLAEVVPDATVDAVLQSIEETVEYFSHAEAPDLVFMDIHLADGPAFRIFDHVEIPCPVVFTTAYDQYALEAFKVNSIDYLLKPIDKCDLQRAIDKYDRLIASRDFDAASLAATVSRLSMLGAKPTYKRTFLIPMGERLIPLAVDTVACFCIKDGIAVALVDDGRSMALDAHLDTIMEQLDPDLFFRANRQYIVAYHAIKEINVWPIGKLALTLTVATPERVVVSKARVPEFERWYTK